MDPQLILSFFIATVLLALMPGPDMIYVLTVSMTRGARNGIAVAAGLCSGVIAHTSAAALGLSLVLQSSELAFTVLKYLGVAYMVYLAFLASREQAIAVDKGEAHTETSSSLWPFYKRGILMNVLNPKVSLFFIAFLPQFATLNGWPATTQFILLGLIFMLSSFLVFMTLALMAGRLSKLLNDPKFWRYTKWAKVSILLLLAFTLAISEI